MLFSSMREDITIAPADTTQASADALASQDLAEQQRASAASAAAMERLEKSREYYRESMAALEERERKLYEEHPWLVEWEKRNEKENSE